MHVQTSTPIHRPIRLPFAAAVVVMFASVIGVAQAVEFDEKVKAPIARSSAQLRSVADSVARDADFSAESRESFIRTPDASRKQFDARWMMVRAVESRLFLGDLSTYGIQPAADGSVRIDLQKYPQWDSFESRVVRMLGHIQMDAVGQDLVNRGMQEADVAKMAAYIASNNAAASVSDVTLPVTLSFAQVVRKNDKLRRAVPDNLVFDYFYQLDVVANESDRRWLAGLLDELEPQGRRILLSYFNEMKATAVWGPSDSEAGIKATLANFRLPDFEQRVRSESAGGVK